MMNRNKRAFWYMILVAGIALTGKSALAHSFNVALVIPQSGAMADQGRQFYDGFMLATTERDSHPDEESDGHLGGLDVYVSVINELGDMPTDADIVAAFASAETLSLIGKQLQEKKIVLLAPGLSPFANSELPAVRAFISAYERAYGGGPSAPAARGYNAARRIDAAVRSQGGVDDRAALRRNFRETARGFSW